MGEITEDKLEKTVRGPLRRAYISMHFRILSFNLSYFTYLTLGSYLLKYFCYFLTFSSMKVENRNNCDEHLKISFIFQEAKLFPEYKDGH